MEEVISESDGDPQPRTITASKRCIQYPRNTYGLSVFGDSNTLLIGYNGSFVSVVGNDNAIRVVQSPGIVAVNGQGNALIVDQGGEEVYISGEGNAVEVGGEELDESAFVLNWVNQQGMVVAKKVSEAQKRVEENQSKQQKATSANHAPKTVEKPQCPICQDDLVSNPAHLKPVIALECGHPFHRECLGIWEKKALELKKSEAQMVGSIDISKSRCPLCRAETVGISRLAS